MVGKMQNDKEDDEKKNKDIADVIAEAKDPRRHYKPDFHPKATTEERRGKVASAR